MPRRKKKSLEGQWRFERRQAQHIERRHRRYLADLNIPADVRRKLGGKRRFVQSLHTDSLTAAELRAGPIIAAWRQRIADARGGADSNADFFRQAIQNAPSEEERNLLKLAAADEAFEIGSTNNPEDPWSDAEAARFYARATLTPFDSFLAEWRAAMKATDKTKDMKEADVKRFAKDFPMVPDVNKAEVKRWCDALMSKHGLTLKTVQRILSALRDYWKYLQSIEQAPPGEPFHALGFSDGGRVRREDRRQPFTPADVVKLAAEARKRGDKDLADVITLGMWTGARIEELCSLEIPSVKLAAPIPHFAVNAGKTDAALREVPICPELVPTLRRLIGKRKEGFVFETLTANKYGDRSNAIGKRFGYLKASLGFGPNFVFHSIRKTVSTLFEN